MRLIDADALYSLLSKEGSRLAEIGTETTLAWVAEIEQIKLYIRKAPTIDAVQVVRCKECRHWWKKNELCVHKKCITGKAAVVEAKAEHFCAYGERKED